MRRSSFLLFIVGAILAPAFALAADAQVRSVLNSTAQGSGFRNICPNYSCLPNVVGTGLNVALGLLSVALIGYVLYGGYLWMTAGGESDQVDSAMQVMRNAFIGFVLVVMSGTLGSLAVSFIEQSTSGVVPGGGVVPISDVSPTSTNGSESIEFNTAVNPFAPGCNRVQCSSLCIQQQCTGLNTATGRFNCESQCNSRCQTSCDVPGQGRGPSFQRCDADCVETCHNVYEDITSISFIRCRDACRVSCFTN